MLIILQCYTLQKRSNLRLYNPVLGGLCSSLKESVQQLVPYLNQPVDSESPVFSLYAHTV